MNEIMVFKDLKAAATSLINVFAKTKGLLVLS